MFILRIGAEALKNADHSLSSSFYTNGVKHSNNHEKFQTINYSNKYQIDNYTKTDQPVDQGILYNLLNKNNTNQQIPQFDNNHNIEMNSLSRALINDRPNSSSLESVKSVQSKPVSLRPSSAPQAIRFHPYTKRKQISNHNNNNNNNGNLELETLNIYPNKMIVEWLRNTVMLMKPNRKTESMLLNVLRLPDRDRIRILKQSWHLIFITYLVEFIERTEKIKSILSVFIKDYNKTEKSGNFKKLFRLTRVFTNDLEIVINQMISLKLNHNLFELLRIAILFTDNQEDIKKKNIELLKPRLVIQSDEYDKLFDQLLDNLFKLDMSMIESVFFGHLSPSVDGIIDELYSNL